MNPLESAQSFPPRSRLLVIEDFPEWRRQVADLLRAERRFDIEAVADAYTALRLTQGSPDWELVVIDLDQPGMNGFELYFRLRDAVAGDLPVVFTTSLPAAGWVGIGDGREARVVQKPVEPAEFLGLVRRGAAALKPARLLPG